MNVLNSTYDINWGAADGLKLQCAVTNSAAAQQHLPVCVNTSFPGYAGNWSMVDNHSATKPWSKGLTTATWFSEEDFGKHRENLTNKWSAELAFPIRANWTFLHGAKKEKGDRTTIDEGEVEDGDDDESVIIAGHGGLLDTSWAQDHSPDNFSRYDPNNGDAGEGRPRYWRIDFARAEHPHIYNLSASSSSSPSSFSSSPSAASAFPS